MKQHFSKILVSVLVTALLFSCAEKKAPINDMQGKVKYEVISIAPKIAGRVLKINAIEGSIAHKGDTLVIIDVPEVNSKLEQSVGALESANAQLEMTYNGATQEQIDQISNQVLALKDQVAFAEKSYKRMQNMMNDSLIPAQQYDEVKMKYESAKSQLASLEAKKAEVIKGARKENIAMAKGQVVRAQGAKNEVLIAMNEKYIIAPSDMLIETVALKVGELALPGYTLISGYETASAYFRFTVAESKINQFKINQTVTVQEPYTKLNISAKIIAVKQLAKYADNTSTSPNYELGESTYELKVLPDAPLKETLYQNSTVLLNTK